MKKITRRDFLRYLGTGAIGLALKSKLTLASTTTGGRASDVIQCYHDNATSGSTINETVVQVMMNASITTLTGIADVGEAWKMVFPGITQNSVIGIKVNCINSSLSTHPEFVNCIVNGLTQMQFSGSPFDPYNIIIWDRTNGELTGAGYALNYDAPGRVRCYGTDQSGVGYDNTCPLTIVTGSGNYTRYPSRILSLTTDYQINATVMKNHNSSQITLCLKQHYGSVNNPGGLPHADYCNPEIPSMNQQIRDVVTPNNIFKIFIVDALFADVTNGPGSPPNCNPKKLLMSLDPVAIDYRGWQVINEERQNLGQNPIDWPIYHIQTASQPPYNLGTTDINLIEINNPQGIAENKSRTASSLLKISPNPFRNSTTIIITLPVGSAIEIDITDSAGRLNEKIYTGYLNRGTHRIKYHPQTELPAGEYFLRLHSNGLESGQKITILR